MSKFNYDKRRIFKARSFPSKVCTHAHLRVKKLMLGIHSAPNYFNSTFLYSMIEFPTIMSRKDLPLSRCHYNYAIIKETY